MRVALFAAQAAHESATMVNSKQESDDEIRRGQHA
jgi:hypothetical protein